MANSSVNCLESVFRFKFNITEFETNDVESPEFTLSNVPWKLLLRKKGASESNDSSVLDVCLVCGLVADNTIAKWSCEMCATFRLLSCESEIVKHLSKKQFNNQNLSHSIDNFISWAELMDEKNQFVLENEAVLEVVISSNPLNYRKSVGMEQTSTKLRVIVDGVSKLGNTYSPEVTVRGIRWKIQTKKEEDHFAVYLWAVEEDMDINWCWDVEYSFKLLSFNSKIEPIDCKTTSDIFRWGTPSWGYGKLIKWSEFVDPKRRFVRNDTAVIEVKFTVQPPKPLWECEASRKETKVSTVLECSICFESFCGREISATKCGHLFCNACITRSIEDRQKCPMCNAAAQAADLRPIFFSW